jgi:replication factor C subunit 3/5
MKNDQLPHLLFYGPPGTGKTSTILACAKQMYKNAEFNAMVRLIFTKISLTIQKLKLNAFTRKKVLELNASDDRGIGVIRDQIMSFASTKTIFNKGFKLIILDEADAMTHDAQNALRRILEKFTENVRFCIICNYLNKIIPAIQSRCTRFRFGPLHDDKMKARLTHIIEQEK